MISIKNLLCQDCHAGFFECFKFGKYYFKFTCSHSGQLEAWGHYLSGNTLFSSMTHFSHRQHGGLVVWSPQCSQYMWSQPQNTTTLTLCLWFPKTHPPPVRTSDLNWRQEIYILPQYCAVWPAPPLARVRAVETCRPMSGCVTNMVTTARVPTFVA